MGNGQQGLLGGGRFLCERCGSAYGIEKYGRVYRGVESYLTII